MPKYKYGKVTAPIDFQTFKDAVENGKFAKGRMLSHKSFIAFLYWFGVRKAEALERTKEDFLVKDGLLIVNAIPKKGGEDGGSLHWIQQKVYSQTKTEAEKGIGMSFRRKSEEVVDAFVSKQHAHFFLLGYG